MLRYMSADGPQIKTYATFLCCALSNKEVKINTNANIYGCCGL